MYASGVHQGRQGARVPPPPHRADRRLGYPQANFFYFSEQIFYFFSTLPHNIIYFPILFASERFSLPSCVFPYLCIFRVSEGKKQGNRNFFLILSASMWLLCALFSFYILILCYFPLLLFPPTVLLSVLCSCIVFCCGCCVFR